MHGETCIQIGFLMDSCLRDQSNKLLPAFINDTFNTNLENTNVIHKISIRELLVIL